MLHPLEFLEKQLSKSDQELLYHLILEQKETNRLLNLLVSKGQEEETPSMTRPEVMKEFAKLDKKPKGWANWKTEDMIKHLEEHA